MSRTRSTGRAVLLGLTAMLLAPPPESDAQSTTKPAGGLPAPLTGVDDTATFLLFKNEERLATMKSALKADGSLTADCTLSFAGQSVESKVTITPDADGRFQRMTHQSAAGEVLMVRDGTTLTITHKGKDTTVELKENVVLFENFTPVLMSQALRRYDAKQGGKQALSILFVGSAIQMNGSLEPLEPVERTVDGRDYRFLRYAYGVPGVDITVWADEAGKLYLADVPAQRAYYVREGFEALRHEPASDPLLSAPTYKVVEERGVRIPMRDGVELATDIYRPEGVERAPVILVRTPYKKEMSELDGFFYARRGYAVAIQDCRGRFGSSGTWEPFVHERDDGYDTVEWLAAQPWSTGKVGMIGASYLGWVQWWAASASPPHLVTMIPNVAPPDPFFNIPYEYGAFFLWGAIWWADVLESEATADLSGKRLMDIFDKKYHKLLQALPVIDLDKAVLGRENPYWRTWIEHDVDGGYWERANFLDRLAETRIPVFHQSGWFDGDGIGSKLNYARMRSHGHPNQKLVLGPWGHQAEASRMIGDRDFGPQAAIDLPRDYLRWFDHWLKDVDNGIQREPLVRIFVMGSNRWLEGDVYPLPQTEFRKLYLTSNGTANTSKGDGALVWEPPAADSPADRYTYDPADPTPAPYYYVDPDEEADDAAAAAATSPAEGSQPSSRPVRSAEAKRKAAKDYHEQVNQTRNDILVYQTPTLAEPLTFAGPLSAVLYASSSARDTDWFVRLSVVEKDGDIWNLVEGRLRARFRHSTRAPELLQAGEVYEFPLDLWQTGVTVMPGQRLRVEIASASFPFFSRNLNTGGHSEKETEFIAAEQTIYHDAARPSHILLPVIAEMEK